ncbi:MAG: chromate transporter [Clostridiales bacterium]|nr:chromate transporter [Clostridiales bacterium]
MIYIQLFFSFLQVGLFSFGGGYAAMPLIQNQVVIQNGWLNMAEFTDLVTISQMTPGPIAINAATFVGIKVAGMLGAIATTLGCIFPSCVIVTIIAALYFKYQSMTFLQNVLNTLRPAVVAMIAAAGISILISTFWGSRTAIEFADTKWSFVLLFGSCFVLLRKWKVSPIWVMILAGVANVIISFIIEIIHG